MNSFLNSSSIIDTMDFCKFANIDNIEKEYSEIKNKVYDVLLKDNRISTEDPMENMNKKLEERNFFNIPNTDKIRNQEIFASWCYGDSGICRKQPSRCLPQR